MRQDDRRGAKKILQGKHGNTASLLPGNTYIIYLTLVVSWQGSGARIIGRELVVHEQARELAA